jgi:hypothetical protein
MTAAAARIGAHGHAAPEVSVIVRSVARPTLAAALDALAAQRDVELEVLVVTASGAGHPRLPRQCGAHPLRQVGGAQPLRRAAAANAGLDAAAAPWITFLDDDDTIAPDHVAGLLRAAQSLPAPAVVHSYADAVFADGRRERFGQPFSLAELHLRNFVHLSSALVPAALVRAGCRFDEALDLHEDWDFFLQLAQHGPFAFAPLATFRWHADAGSSGAGGGRNHDPARFAECRDRVYAKWQGRREHLVDAVTDALQRAQALAQAGSVMAALHVLHGTAQVSPNDPHVLNLAAMLQRQQGQLAQAHASQALAVAVRPHDPALVFNLALVALARRDAALARQCCERTLALDPAHATARRLREQLAADRADLPAPAPT